MKKTCPACQQSFKGTTVLSALKNNFAKRYPLFSFPCPHCGARLASDQKSWLIGWAAFALLWLDLLSVLSANLFFRVFAATHFRPIAAIAATLYIGASLFLLWSIFARRYERLSNRLAGRVTGSEAIALSVIGFFFASNLIVGTLLLAGFGTLN